MIGVIRNGMNLLNVDSFFQPIVIGVVIVLAVEADVLRGRLGAAVPACMQAAGHDAPTTDDARRSRRPR